VTDYSVAPLNLPTRLLAFRYLPSPFPTVFDNETVENLQEAVTLRKAVAWGIHGSGWNSLFTNQIAAIQIIPGSGIAGHDPASSIVTVDRSHHWFKAIVGGYQLGHVIVSVDLYIDTKMPFTRSEYK